MLCPFLAGSTYGCPASSPQPPNNRSCLQELLKVSVLTTWILAEENVCSRANPVSTKFSLLLRGETFLCWSLCCVGPMTICSHTVDCYKNSWTLMNPTYTGLPHILGANTRGSKDKHPASLWSHTHKCLSIPVPFKPWPAITGAYIANDAWLLSSFEK